ncbi:MAG: 16S rRNA methyltransferase [Candidatus Bathyarchaeia archaeon]
MIDLLILVLAEAALEPIPREIWDHPIIRSFSRRRGKHPRLIVLDRSHHHFAMKDLPNSEKRGRPDIVHFCLLEALGSPLNKEGLLRTYVHTIDDNAISIDPETRLPRNFNRFIGLIEDLFKHGHVPPKGKSLLSLETRSLPRLIEALKPTYTVIFERSGEPKTFEDVALKLAMENRPAVLVGGFPHGEFSEETIRLADEVVCVDSEVLDAWVIVSRIIYEYERAIGLPKKRLEQLINRGS